MKPGNIDDSSTANVTKEHDGLRSRALDTLMPFVFYEALPFRIKPQGDVHQLVFILKVRVHGNIPFAHS
jgi:hypothetical protein